MTGLPARLRENQGVAFQGTCVLGKGFILEPGLEEFWIAKDPTNADVLAPYLNGEDLKQSAGCYREPLDHRFRRAVRERTPRSTGCRGLTSRSVCFPNAHRRTQRSTREWCTNGEILDAAPRALRGDRTSHRSPRNRGGQQDRNAGENPQ